MSASGAIAAGAETRTAPGQGGPQLPAQSNQHRTPRWVIRLRRALLPVLLLVGWQVLAESGMFRPVFMPPLQVIGDRLVELASSGVLLQASLASLGRLLAGFGLGIVTGISIGLLVTRLAFAEQMAVRLLSALLATPAVAWTPLFILWFGLGNSATVALVVFSATIPIALNTWSGIRTVDRTYLRVAESMDVRGLSRFFKVVLPAAFAPVLSGLRLGFARGWHGLVAGELLAGTATGLGVLITNGRVFLDTPSMFAGVLALAVLAYVTERIIFERLERRLLQRWGLTQ